jgi:hypothetical protein
VGAVPEFRSGHGGHRQIRKDQDGRTQKNLSQRKIVPL